MTPRAAVRPFTWCTAAVYLSLSLSAAFSPGLVYGLLSALLVGVYAGLVVLFGRLLDPATGDSALAVAASTLTVAALFQPASASLWLRPR